MRIRSCMTLAAALAHMKYESGDAAFVYDMTTFGPQLGLALDF